MEAPSNFFIDADTIHHIKRLRKTMKNRIRKKRKKMKSGQLSDTIENINRFWFIQIQALGKLYRKDYLISSHLANMNCNETLVMQIVLRV